MKRQMRWILFGGAVAALALTAQQQSDIKIILEGGARPVIAIPDLRGSGDALKFMDEFNATLQREVGGAGIFKMASKSFFPLQVPQQPADFKPPLAPTTVKRGERPEPIRQGPWLTDWSGPPVSANYLAFGYTAAQADRFVLNGWLFNVNQNDMAGAQVLGKVYVGSMDAAGARKVAQEFAADILKLFGGQSLMGSHIYFVSTRTGHKEIWGMDYDGANQHAITRYGNISTYPAVSPDGSKVAFTTWLRGTPELQVMSVETGRRLPFYNPHASANGTPEFSPDGTHLLFCSSITGFTQIYMADLDGRNLQRLTNVRAVEVSPRVNPKTGRDIVFVSGRSGPAQIYKMNMDGADLVRLTPGEGEAANPAWHPDGKFIAFAWTRGYAPGNYNIFVMDVATQQYVQLTHGAGRNENPYWAPDGRHLVFSSNRKGSTQIYTMLADGTDVRQLTSAGSNEKPVWGK
jgi:TolB protein